jgi:phosphatidylglycerophosphatase C
MSLVLGGGARDNAKAAMAFSILKGCPEEEVNRSAKVVAQTVLRGNLRPDVVRRVRWHQREGHKVVIVSASFEAYVRIVASELGIKDVLATSWEVEDGHLTGKLAGANVRGPEKATRLLAALSPGERVCWAYGDSAGDREMLALAERPLLVEPRHPVPDFATQGVVE